MYNSLLQRDRRWIAPAAAALLSLVAAVVRFYDLGGRSFWLDEVAVWDYSSTPGFWNMLSRIHSAPSLTPGVFVLDRLTLLLARGDAALRVHAAIAGILCVPMIYVLGRRLFSARIGVLSALVTALLPFYIWYSQENAAYAMFTLLTTIQMLFAYMAVTDGRLTYWVGFVFTSILNLYTHEIALTATAAAFTYVGVALLIPAIQRWRHSRRLGALLAPAGLVFNSALAVTIGYIPWIDALILFTHHQELGLSRFDASHHASLADVYALLGAYGFSGLALGLLVVGIGAAAVQMQAKRHEVGLLAAWIGVPLAAFAYQLRGGLVLIWPRYLIFLVPAAALLVAVGIDGLARGGAAAVARQRNLVGGRVQLALAVGMAAALVVQFAPAIAASYATPKDDWRGTVEHIVQHSSPGSVVVSVGNFADWSDLCLGYYIRQLKANVTMIDGLQMTSDEIGTLKHSAGTTWGVINHPSPEQLRLMTSSGDEMIDFVDATSTIYLVRSTDQTLSTVGQVSRLLRWENVLQPQLGASIGLLALASGGAQLGPNLVPTPAAMPKDGWVFGPGVTVTDGVIDLTAPGPDTEVNAAFNMTGLDHNHAYMLAFDHRDRAFSGWQAVYAVALDTSSRDLQTFPSGTGYRCAATDSWARSYFAVQIPPNTARIVLFLRAHGVGTAEFRNIQFSQISEAE